MSPIFDRARQIAGEAGSAVLCGASGLNRVTNDIVGKINPLYRGSALDRFRDRVSDALDRFCPVPGGPLPPPPEQPGFTGGQCSVRYDADIIRTDGSGQEIPSTTFVDGPVVGIESEPIAGTEEGRQFFLVGMGGSQRRFITSGNPPVSARLVSVTRQDGQPDNCGDPSPVPPPDVPPPTDPRPTPTTEPIVQPDGTTISVTFAPVVGIVYADVDGSIRVPVTVNVTSPDLVFSPEFNFDINLSDPAEPPEPIDPAPPKDEDDRPEQPDCPLPPDCGEEPEEEDPDDSDEDERDEKGQIIAGAVVLSVRSGGRISQTELLQGSAPSIFIPYLALATFVYERPGGGLCYSTDIPIKRLAQAIPAPRVGYKVVGVRCSWERGWSGEVFEVIAADCCD